VEDYKSNYRDMYYHLAGRMAVAVDTLEVTTTALEAHVAALVELKEKLKLAQQTTEDMFINCEDNEEEN